MKSVIKGSGLIKTRRVGIYQLSFSVLGFQNAYAISYIVFFKYFKPWPSETYVAILPINEIYGGFAPSNQCKNFRYIYKYI